MTTGCMEFKQGRLGKLNEKDDVVQRCIAKSRANKLVR